MPTSNATESTRPAPITLSALLGSFRVIDTTTYCKANHSPKDRRGFKVKPEEAIDEDGALRRKYEALTDSDGNKTGEYALRDDAPVFVDADALLKDCLRAINGELADVCYSIGGGTLVLTEANYDAWPPCVARIEALVKACTEELAKTHVEKDDPLSPLVNDVLASSGKKPIGLTFKPVLHPIVKIADPEARAQAVALVESTRQQVREVIEAVASADPDRIGDVLKAAKDIDKAIADGGTRDSIRRVLETARRAKAAAETERAKRGLLARANERLEGRTLPAGASSEERDRLLAAIERDNRAINGFTVDQTAALRLLATARADMAEAAGVVDERFGAIVIDDEAIAPVATEDWIRLFGSAPTDRFAGLALESDADVVAERTEEQRIAVAARTAQVDDAEVVTPADTRDVIVDEPPVRVTAEVIAAEEPLAPIERTEADRAALKRRIQEAQIQRILRANAKAQAGSDVVASAK